MEAVSRKCLECEVDVPFEEGILPVGATVLCGACFCRHANRRMGVPWFTTVKDTSTTPPVERATGN